MRVVFYTDMSRTGRGFSALYNSDSEARKYQSTYHMYFYMTETNSCFNSLIAVDTTVIGSLYNSLRLIRLFSKISKIEEKNLQIVTHLNKLMIA